MQHGLLAYGGVLDVAPAQQCAKEGCGQQYQSLCRGRDDKRDCTSSLLTLLIASASLRYYVSMRIRRHGTLKRSAAARKTSACASTLLCDGLV